MTLQDDYGSVVAGPVLSQAWPEMDDPCWLCGHETRGTYVVWGLSTGELVHVCDQCVSDGDREDEPEDMADGFREGQPEFNGAFGNG